MNLTASLPSRRDFLRACLLAGAALAVPRWVSGVCIRPAPEKTSLLLPGLKIIPYSTWSAFIPRVTQMKPASGYSRLTVHHAGSVVNTHVEQNDVIMDLRGIQEVHLQKSYGDIGYHFIIDYAGRIWEGRSLAFQGAHVSGMNEENAGIMLLGNFEKQTPSTDQITSLFRLVRGLQHRYAIPHKSIYGHCDLGLSVCPGKNLYVPFVTELQQS